MSWSGLILVAAGVLLLLGNFGLLQWGWLRDWWPVGLIALGLWSILRPQRVGRATRRDGAPKDADRTA